MTARKEGWDKISKKSAVNATQGLLGMVVANGLAAIVEVSAFKKKSFSEFFHWLNFSILGQLPDRFCGAKRHFSIIGGENFTRYIQ